MDKRTLERAWRRDRRWVAAILLAHMPRECDLEDLLQEVALALVRHHRELRDPEKLRPWLRTVALNVARGAARKRGSRSRQEPLDRHAERLIDRRGLGPRGDDRRATDRVLEAVCRLPSHYRELLLLRCVEGLSQRRIAEILELKETTVESRLVRARRRLRREMKPTPEPEQAGLPDLEERNR